MIVVGKPKRRGCGCVKLGGCRPSGGLAGMGEVTPAALQAEVQKHYDQTKVAFAKPMTFAQLYKVIVPHLELADKLVGTAKTMKLRAGQLAEGVAAAARLRTVRNQAKIGYVNTPNQRAGALQSEALEAVLARMRWQAGIVGQALTDSNARAQFVKDAAKKAVNAPGDILAWAAEQAKKPLKELGLPGWVIPVGLVAAGLLVAGPYVLPLVMAARKRGAT